MTDDALRALRDAVKAGTIDCKTPHCDLPAMHVLGAYAGSLDAAHALHKAVLPGWEWKRIVNPGPIASVGVWEPPKFVMGQTAKEVDGNTARAWLLAILEALIAQQGAWKGGE